MHISFKKQLFDEEREYFIFKDGYFNSIAQTILNYDYISDSLIEANWHILNKTAVWLAEGSGWIIELIACTGHFVT